METLHDINKFSVPQLFSDKDGKTSGSGFAGIITIVTGSICFLLGCIDKMWLSHTIDVMTNSIWLITSGTALLGVRKYITAKNPDPNAVVDSPDVPVEENKDE